ncbi:MAG: DNA-binding protein WhiA [Roseburia sp.]|nr:DNA-binding protein WhiA [Roseburia sp.]
MSFSSEVKQELAATFAGSRHCMLAELAAIINHTGKVGVSQGRVTLLVQTDNELLLKKYGTLLQRLFQIKYAGDLSQEDTLRVLEGVKLWDRTKNSFKNTAAVDGILIQQTCCKRAFIRGAFLSAGSISNPAKGYHFEIVCTSLPQAKQIQAAMNCFDVDAKIVSRKKNQVVYVKEGAHIVDLLNVMEAHVALMDLENVRIVKEMRNSVNRQVNCETANISKTVNAAVRQIEDISYIRDHMGLESLPDHLREMALLRLQYPDAPLKELGEYLNPPVGKSGVNHRLRKLSKIAEEMR